MSYLETEIHEQPTVLRRLLAREAENLQRLAEQFGGRFDYVVIAARGSSDNAARYAQYLFGAQNGLPVSLATPSLYSLYSRPPSLKGALVIGISQSGQSPDIVSVVAAGRAQGCPTLAITNDSQSPLATVAEDYILLHAGEERAIAATKTYTASLGAIALLSATLPASPLSAAQKGEEAISLGWTVPAPSTFGTESGMGTTRAIENLQLLPALMEHAIENVLPILPRVERYRYMAHCVVIGRSYNYATAFEIALKIKELTRVVAEPYSSADFRHGPIAMVRDGFPVLLVAPSGIVFEDLRTLADDLKKIDSELIIISDNLALLEQAHLALPLPQGVPEYLSPLVTVIAGQLFSLTLAEAKGLNPDNPEGLRKVTETR